MVKADEYSGGYYPDDLNKDNQIKTGQDYFTIPAVGLNINSLYAFEFRWIYPDGKSSPWSDGYAVATSAISTLPKPKLTAGNVSYFQGILKVTWDGTDFNGTAYGNAFSRVLVWIRDNSDPSPLFKILGELTRPGTFQIAVPPKSQTVKIQAISIDGAFSVYSDDFTITPVVAAPSAPTGLSAAWSGTDFTVSFTSDPSSPENEYLKEYLVTLTASDNQTKVFSLVPKSGSSQKFSLSLQENQAAFGAASKSFSGSVQTLNIYGSKGTATSFNSTAFASVLPVPVISVTETINGYSVAYTTPTSNTFNKIHIEEVVSESLTAPSTGYSEVINGSSNPISYPSGSGKRWIRARFSDTLNTYTSYSNIDDVSPIDIIAAAVDALAPDPIQSATASASADTTDSSGLSGIINLTIVNATSTVPSDFNGYIVKVIRSSDSRQWTQEFLSKTYLTTLPVKLGITTGQSYTLSVATTDGRNQSSFINVTGNPISVTDTRTNTSVATSLLLSATDSILTVRWTAPNDTNVGSYRVQITTNADTTFSTPLQEVYAQSTTASFGGLTASTTYRIRVTSKYSGSNGALSTNHLTGTATLNSSGAISDGIRPSYNPSPVTVKSLFKAFALTWPEITNTDDVTYEVYVKTTNSTGIVDPANLAMEINGTFAVINSLKDGTAIAYPDETSPTSATDYYFAVRAKDADGISTAAVTAVGPFTASRTGQFDIATNAIYANHITAGQINADKMITDLLFTNKTINVGESTSLNRIRLDANTVVMTDTALPLPSTYTAKSRIFIGAGNYYSSGTSLYADNTGRFSISDKLKFDGTNLTINGSGTFTGLLTTGSGSNVIKVGTGANGANNGIYVGATSDYIYTDGTFSLGAGKVTYSSGLLQIDGQLKVKNNSTLEGDLQLLSPGIFYIGTNKTIGGAGDKIIIDSGGIAAYPSGSSSAKFSLDKTGFAKLDSANIAGWTTDTQKIAKTTTVGTDSWTIKVDSSTGSVQVDATGYTAGFGVPDANNIVFWAGSSRSAAPFKVYKDGSVSLPAAVFDGYVTDGELSSGLSGKISTGGAATDVNNNTTTISGNKIRTGSIQSTTWNGTVTNGSDYSTSGMTINLTNGGSITAKNFRIAEDGTAFFKGTLSSGISIDAPIITGGQINIGNGTFTVSNTGVINASSGIFSGNVQGGTFSLSGYTSTNYWSGSSFNAGSASSYINVGASSGTITLFSSQSQSLDADEGGGLSSYSIDQKIVVNSSAITIQGIPGVGNGLTAYGNLLGPFGDGVASTLITNYWAAGYYTAGREPSYNYGAAARYRMVIADPYDYNKLKRGFGVYYGVRGTNSVPSASTGYVGDIWISW